jgi:hypothetical protein
MSVTAAQLRVLTYALVASLTSLLVAGLGPAGTSGPAAAGAVAFLAALTLVAVLRTGHSSPPRSVARRLAAVRRHEPDHRTDVWRLADPDAAGRPRPHAPGHRPSAG